jgi:ATP-dependent protease ClpP protease subunit
LTDYESDPVVAAALAQKYTSEAMKLEAEAMQAKFSAQASAIHLEKLERERQFFLAADIEHQVYHLNGVIEENSVTTCQEHLSRWSRLKPGSDMTIILNSQGGWATYGMELFDFIQELKRQGHLVTIHARGWAASMGSVLLQAASPGRRLMGAEAYQLVHQVSSGAHGSLGELEDQMKYLEIMTERVLNIYATRCAEAGENGTAASALTRGQLKQRWKRTDWWVSSADSLAFGLIDAVR